MKQQKIGPKIRDLRKTKNLTQNELAKSLGYSGKSVIAHIEKGDADMTYEKILLLLRTYALDANMLFDVKQIDKNLEDWRRDQQNTKKVVVYIHGLHGSSKEVEDYSYLNDEYDLVGLDYQDGNPWELKDTIQNEFKKLTEHYKEIVVIANSIGAFYAYEYLSDFNIKQAFFISPVASMVQIIVNTMMTKGISRHKLEEEKFIKIDDDITLSYDFYKSLENHRDNWNVQTEILYGSRDELVYPENILDFLESHPRSRLTIKRGTNHYFHTDEDRAFIKQWILQTIN